MDAPENLADAIHEFMKDEPNQTVQHSFVYDFIRKNMGAKVVSVIVAASLWGVFVYQNGVVTQEYDVPIEFRYVPANLSVAQSFPTDVKITVSGNSSDMENFDTKDLQAFVNMKDVKVGDSRFNLSKDNIKIPSYLDVSSISPKNVEVLIKENK